MLFNYSVMLLHLFCRNTVLFPSILVPCRPILDHPDEHQYIRQQQGTALFPATLLTNTFLLM